MSRTVKCAKLGQELPGLDYPPMKGELGRRIYESISRQAWELWLRHSTMVINEYRLDPTEPNSQKALRAELEKFLFGGGAEPPPDFKPPPRHHH